MNKLQAQINQVLKNNGTFAYEYAARVNNLFGKKVKDVVYANGDHE